MLKYLKWFWRYYRNHKRALAVLLTVSLLTSALLVIRPILLKNIIDLLQSGQTRPVNLPYLGQWIQSTGGDRIANYVVMLILFGLAGFVVRTILVGHRAYMNIRLEWEFRQAAFEGVSRKGPDFFNRFPTGDLVTRMTDDCSEDKLAWFACSGIFRCYESLMLIAFSLVMMLSINPRLTAWTAGPLPVLVLVYMRTSSVLHRRFDFLQKRISIVNNIMEACFSGIRVVKAYVREKDQQRRFADATEDRKQAEVAAVRSHTIMECLWMYIWQLGIVIVLLAGGYYVIKGRLTIGEFVAFDSYVMFLIYPMFDVGNFLVRGLRATVSVNRLKELEHYRPMIAEEDQAEPGVATEPKGHVEFDKVSFRFPGQEADILSDVSFAVEPGRRVSLVGRVGSGKSWLVRLVPRLVDPTSGRVLIDGVDLRDYDIHAIRRHIGYVPQEPILFSDTIESNIRFGRDDIDSDTLNWAIDVSQLRKELDSFPKGAATRIGVRGMSISGGQKQRVALARALAGKPRILILDDCTSALDAKTEAALWDRLHQVMPELTCFIITHRPATLELSDEVIVLDDGNVVERGTHAELIGQQGLYWRLYQRIMLEEAVGEGDPAHPGSAAPARPQPQGEG
jgi:ATP-binding cassette subfamily B multidrug efflux pump